MTISRELKELIVAGNLEIIKQGALGQDVKDWVAAGAIAAENGHDQIVEYLIKSIGETYEAATSEDEGELLDEVFYDLLNEAAKEGNNQAARFIVALSAYRLDIKEMLPRAFRFAAENGHFEIVKLIVESTEESKRQKLIHFDDNSNDYAFKKAAENGHLEIVEYLIAATPDQELLQNMIHSEGDYAFEEAARNGHIEIMNLLISLTTDQDRIRGMLRTNDGASLYWAATNKDSRAANCILISESDSDERLNMIEESFDAFSKSGDLESVKFLTAIARNRAMLPNLTEAEVLDQLVPGAFH